MGGRIWLGGVSSEGRIQVNWWKQQGSRFLFLFKEDFSYNLSHSSVDLASFKGVSS